MIRIKNLCLFASFISILLFIGCNSGNSAETETEKYNWKNVTITGGGFVDGIIFHPTESGLRYARTDMGGAYRWEESEQRWIPLTDWISYDDRNLMGIESIALDPNNPDKLIMACGTYTDEETPDGEILVSTNRGETFTRIKIPVKFGGNENGRGNGERMMIDPANSNIVYLGTRHAGLWRSTDGGYNWQQVESFPDVSESAPDSLTQQDLGFWNWAFRGSGIFSVIFDPASANNNGSQTIYAGVSIMNRENIFRSTNGGLTWQALPGHPTQYRPTSGVLSPDGNLYFTYGDVPGPYIMNNGGVWKFNTKTEKWIDITPDSPSPDKGKKFGYADVAVDPSNPQTIITSVFHRSHQYGSDDIYHSTNGGKTWTAVFTNGTTFDYSKAPYIQHTPIHWMFDIEINPFYPDHAIFTTGFGGFETFNLSNVDKGEPTSWSVYTQGIEETVPLELCSPPTGANLITAIGDYAGFVHWNLDKAEEGQYFTNPYFGNCDGITCAWKNPAVLVRVGIASGHHGGSNIGYSTNYGKSWQAANMPTPASKHGHIAVSSDGKTWVWTPQNQHPFRTNNFGESWEIIENIPIGTRVIADKENPLKFYAADLYTGILFNSYDGAETFEATELDLAKGTFSKELKMNDKRGDKRGGQDHIYATPGYENDLWIAAYDGLYHAPKGKNIELLNQVSEIHGFGFGKEAPGKKYPALYLIGKVNGVHGIFRSTNKAKNWIRINDDQHQWGLLLHITGDPKKYGRVYVGTHGRGALYGDPTK
ncbi:MAG: hypothetical protein PF436_07140 [Prolixibacteraceae bacterium]|jgi:hypothetical protein|nr:hypothetical protein [Prolixibacteraceae bacterium]